MKYVIENEATVSRPEREPELIVSVLFAFLAFIRGPNGLSYEQRKKPVGPRMNAKCAGINRHGAGNERVPQKRSSEPF